MHRFLLILLLLAATKVSYAQSMRYPLDAVRSEDGTAFVADLRQPGVWKHSESKLSLFFQASKTFRTPLNRPRCVAFDQDGSLLVGDTSTREVYRFDKDGKPVPLTGGKIGMPMAIAVAQDGTIYVADLDLKRIYRIAKGRTDVFAKIEAPRGVAIDRNGDILVVSTTKDQVFRVTPEGKSSVLVPGRPFDFPHQIAATRDGSIFVADGYGKCIWKIDETGKPSKWVTDNRFENPVGLSLSGEKLLVTDSRANTVFEIDPASKAVEIAVK